MALINFSDIDCKQSIDKTNKTIIFNNSEIEILNYLSAQDKYDLVMVTLQKSFEDGIYNLVKMQIYFDLHLVLLYTNIVFSMEDREDEINLYDLCARSGLISAVKNAIGDIQVQELWDTVVQNANHMMGYHSSFESGMINIGQMISDKIKIVLDTLREISPELIQEISEASPKLGALLKPVAAMANNIDSQE